MPDPPPETWITWIKELGLPTVFLIGILVAMWKGGSWAGPKILDLFAKFVNAQVEATKKTVDLQQQALALHKENSQTLKVQSDLLQRIVEADKQIFRGSVRKKKP